MAEPKGPGTCPNCGATLMFDGQSICHKCTRPIGDPMHLFRSAASSIAGAVSSIADASSSDVEPSPPASQTPAAPWKPEGLGQMPSPAPTRAARKSASGSGIASPPATPQAAGAPTQSRWTANQRPGSSAANRPGPALTGAYMPGKAYDAWGGQSSSESIARSSGASSGRSLGALVAAGVLAIGLLGAVIFASAAPVEPDYEWNYPTDDFTYDWEATPFPTEVPSIVPTVVEPSVEPTAETTPDASGSPGDGSPQPSGSGSARPSGAAAVTLVTAGNLATARAEHTATRLADGRVAIIGGRAAGPNAALASIEIYNPATRKFSSGGRLQTPRYGHTATLLGDGRILVAGGLGRDEVALSSAEIYDPVTRTSSPVGDLSNSRDYASATLMADGTVLIVGGDKDGPVTMVERFDSRLGQFEELGDLQSVHLPLPVVALPDGRFVVIGSVSADRSAESLGIYDPSGSLEPPNVNITSDSRSGRWGAGSCLLADGRILIAGGRVDGDWAAIEVIDPGNFASFLDSRPRPELIEPRDMPTVTALADGGALIVGGTNSGLFPIATIERWDPETGLSTKVAPMPQPRSDHTATLLADGAVLIVGGRSTYGIVATAVLAVP